MVEHHHRSVVNVQLDMATDDLWSAVPNRPPSPDLEGRENVPDAAIPRRSDKEVYKIMLKALCFDGSSTGQPGVVVTDNRGDAVIGNLQGAGTFPDSSRSYEESDIDWWPDIHGSKPAVDQLILDLDQDPIPWEIDDLVHLGVSWPNGEIRVFGTLFWRHA